MDTGSRGFQVLDLEVHFLVADFVCSVVVGSVMSSAHLLMVTIGHSLPCSS